MFLASATSQALREVLGIEHFEGGGEQKSLPTRVCIPVDYIHLILITHTDEEIEG